MVARGSDALRCRRYGTARVIDGADDELEPDFVDAEIAQIVDQIAPRVGEASNAGDERNDAPDLKIALEYPPTAEQQRHDDLGVRTQIHQEVHGELQLENAHVDPENALDASGVFSG